MSAAAEVVVHHDAALLAEAVAARIITRLVDVQATRPRASIVLTGGGTGIAVLTAVCASPARDTVDWGRLEIWWGDERFLPAGDPERNETQARAALLDQVDLDPEHVHPILGSDQVADSSPEAAAEAYAALLAAHAHGAGAVPRFDVLLLGMGGEGHVGSVFPDSPAVHDERAVVAVHDCPKPPPLRVTLTLATFRAAGEAWLVVAGAEKAEATARALAGAGEVQVPAAGVAGRSRTLWLLDTAAASLLPAGLARRTSP